MTNIEAYKIWAPDNALWTEWVKTVLFANMKNSNSESFMLKIQNINWLNRLEQNTAVIVDLPGEKSVEESLALAYMGYRPVPLYNGICAQEANNNMIVDVNNLSQALYAGAEQLSSINIKNEAPPVFMLDSRRMKAWSKSPGMYDNRWCIFPQDMPSAAFLKKHNIDRVIVRTELTQTFFAKAFYEDNIQQDLSHVLYRYQEAGIKIQISCAGNLVARNGNDEVKDITISKPPQYKSLFYRISVILGLSRNMAGGFGRQIGNPN